MPKKPALDFLADVFEDCSSGASEVMTPVEKVKLELENYMRMPICPMNRSPFTWWKENCKQLPMMASLAKNLLVIQASSVSSERVFSTAGDVASSKRSCLSPDSVDKLVFLNKNQHLISKSVPW